MLELLRPKENVAEKIQEWDMGRGNLPISPKENNTKYSSVKLKPKATCREKRRYLAFDRWTGLTNRKARHG